MDEHAIRALVKEQLAEFVDAGSLAAIEQWELLVEPAPNGWLLYRVNDDIGIAYSLAENWAETPWGVVHGFSEDDPFVQTYYPDLEDAVRDVIYDGDPPPSPAEVDQRAAAMEKARQKRLRKGK